MHVILVILALSVRIDDIEDNSKLRRGIPGILVDTLPHISTPSLPHISTPSLPAVAHSIYGVAQTINSANLVYFLAMERTLALGHPCCLEIFTSETSNCVCEC